MELARVTGLGKGSEDRDTRCALRRLAVLKVLPWALRLWKVPGSGWLMRMGMEVVRREERTGHSMRGGDRE